MVVMSPTSRRSPRVLSKEQKTDKAANDGGPVEDALDDKLVVVAAAVEAKEALNQLGTSPQSYCKIDK